MRLAKFLPILAIILASAASTGCLKVVYSLNVKPDGSGTITSTTAIATAMKQQAAMFAGGSGSLVPTEAKFKAQAAHMGAGVRFVGTAPYKTAGFEGTTATYTFSDVSTLKLNVERVIAGALDAPQAQGSVDSAADVKLTFTRNGPGAALRIGMPEVPKPDDDLKRQAQDTAKQAQSSPQLEAMMKQMMQGMLVEMAVNIDGQIVKTNAPYVEKSRVILVRLDGDALLKSGRAASQLIQMGAAPDFQKRLLQLPGVKVVTLPEVRIDFR